MRNEIRYAVRGLLRDRVFALMIVLSLAVGIGANTAIFSLINGVLLRPPDFPHPERLVALTQWAPKLLKAYPALPVNIAIYSEWRKRVAAFEQVGIARAAVFNLTGSGQPEQVRGALVSSTIFPVFGVQPRLGRGFTEREDQSGSDQVVILADSLWRRRYRADPAIIGRRILLDGKPYEVVGVLPASFHFPRQEKYAAASLGEGLEVYKPLGYEPGDLEVHMGDFNYWTTARLRPGVSPAGAQAELDVVQAAISQQLPGDLDLHASLIPLQERMVGDVRQGLVLLMAAVGAVLLVLCVNLANLGLARAAGRARDSAIRTALGASRGRLLRQSIVESTLLALTGGALGIALAYWGLRVLLAVAPIELPRLKRSPCGRPRASVRPGHLPAHRPDFRRAAGFAEHALRAHRDPKIGRPREYRRARRSAGAQCPGEPRSRAQRGAAGRPPACWWPVSAGSCPSIGVFRWSACWR